MAVMTRSKAKVLLWDIETSPFKVWTFRLGSKVSLYHNQIVKGTATDIISIAYMWDYEDEAHVLDWGYEEQDSSKMVEEFDKILRQSDIAIAQNGDRFDVKHINTQRMLHNLPPMPDWSKYTDDLLKQTRKHFALPSYKLDYLSELFGLGGKNDMELQDWINIVEKNEGGKESFERMLRYNKKDVEDLKTIWNRVKYHVTPKLNMSTLTGGHACTNCGSERIKRNGTRVRGQTLYQSYYCNEHGGFAGELPISKAEKLK